MGGSQVSCCLHHQNDASMNGLKRDITLELNESCPMLQVCCDGSWWFDDWSLCGSCDLNRNTGDSVLPFVVSCSSLGRMRSQHAHPLHGNFVCFVFFSLFLIELIYQTLRIHRWGSPSPSWRPKRRKKSKKQRKKHKSRQEKVAMQWISTRPKDKHATIKSKTLSPVFRFKSHEPHSDQSSNHQEQSQHTYSIGHGSFNSKVMQVCIPFQSIHWCIVLMVQTTTDLRPTHSSLVVIFFLVFVFLFVF